MAEMCDVGWCFCAPESAPTEMYRRTYSRKIQGMDAKEGCDGEEGNDGSGDAVGAGIWGHVGLCCPGAT